MIPLIDLHCDTFSRIFKNKTNFDDCTLHISSKDIKNFCPYIQVFAIWSDCSLNNDDAYVNYKSTLHYVKSLGFNPLLNLDSNIKFGGILAIEDARVLNNDIKRLYDIFLDGVRILTLNWKDISCIGGAWNTAFPLTSFGKEVIKVSNELGIIVDLSHSSLQVQREALKITKKPVIFSHSNAYSVCPHSRNLSDEIFKEIVNINGIVGISMCVNHLSSNPYATSSDILRHVDWYLHLGGENNIALGCDFDGIDTLPYSMHSSSDLQMLYKWIENEFSYEIANKLFYHNARNFLEKNLI